VCSHVRWKCSTKITVQSSHLPNLLPPYRSTAAEVLAAKCSASPLPGNLSNAVNFNPTSLTLVSVTPAP